MTDPISSSAGIRSSGSGGIGASPTWLPAISLPVIASQLPVGNGWPGSAASARRCRCGSCAMVGVSGRHVRGRSIRLRPRPRCRCRPPPGRVSRSNAREGIGRCSGPCEPRRGTFTAGVFRRRPMMPKSGTARSGPTRRRRRSTKPDVCRRAMPERTFIPLGILLLDTLPGSGQACPDRRVTGCRLPTALAGRWRHPDHFRIEPTSRDIAVLCPAGPWIAGNPRCSSALLQVGQVPVRSSAVWVCPCTTATTPDPQDEPRSISVQQGRIAPHLRSEPRDTSSAASHISTPNRSVSQFRSNQVVPGVSNSVESSTPRIAVLQTT